MNKINFQDLPDTSTPLNASNMNQLQANIEAEFNMIEDYSTTEQTIGIWKNGKPIYRKVVSFMPKTKTSSFNHNISNIKQVLPMTTAGWNRTGNIFMPMPFSYVTSSDVLQAGWNASFQITPNAIQIYMGDDAFNSIDSTKEGITAVIYYTKTTD